jgi:hypothetical protein
MDTSITEYVNIARKWETEETKVNAYMEMFNGPQASIRLNGCTVRAQPERIVIETAKNRTILPFKMAGTCADFAVRDL